MIQLISTVSITQNGENLELSFEPYIRKDKKKIKINQDLGKSSSFTNENNMASCCKKYRKNCKIEISPGC